VATDEGAGSGLVWGIPKTRSALRGDVCGHFLVWIQVLIFGKFETMLSFSPHTGGGAKGYFTESLDRGDYYLDGQELPGKWRGKGASMLGLFGEVEKRDFFRLCDNHKPDDSKLTPRTKSNRRVGYDITLDCPKSFSIVYGISGDPAMMRVFENAVDATIALIEANMMTRVRMKATSHDRLTGNIICSRFIHQTARPVGGIPDTQVHAHCFVFNATYDKEEERWKAGQFGKLVKSAPFFEQFFHTELRMGLEAIGYKTRNREDGYAFELSQITDAMIEKCSERTKQIEAEAKRLGIEDPVRKSELGPRTRERKNKSWQMDELREEWRSRFTTDELNTIQDASTEQTPRWEKSRDEITDRDRGWCPRDESIDEIRWYGDAPPLPEPGKAAKKAIAFAAGHHFERQAVVREDDLLASAMKFSDNRIDYRELYAALEQKELIRQTVDGDKMITSRLVLEQEQEMLNFAREERGQKRKFVSHSRLKHRKLTDHQRDVLKEMLDSRDTITILEGKSGTGKNTLMKAFRNELRVEGKRVHAFAPTTRVVNDTLKTNGFKHAETVTKLLTDKTLQSKMRGSVIWIDESNQLGTQTVQDVFTLVKSKGARVVFTGDSENHRSPARGNPFRQLQREAGLKSAELRKNLRSEGEYADAVDCLAKGKAEEGFNRLDKLGFIQQCESEKDAHRKLADDYVAAGKMTKWKKPSLVICPTHQEGEALNRVLRKQLREANRIRGKERKAQRFKPLYFSDAEIRNGERFERDQVIRFHQKTRGFNAGDKTKVIGTDPLGQVWVRGKLGPLVLKRSHADRLSVYEADKINVAKGDMLRITQNGMDATGKFKLRSGETGRVFGIAPGGDIILTKGKIIPSGYGHFDHNYVTTSYGSQSKTADRVFVSQCLDSMGEASTREQFYVSASRGRSSVKFYTDVKEKLKEHVTAVCESVSATELNRLQGPASLLAHRERLKKQHEQDKDQSFDRYF